MDNESKKKEYLQLVRKTTIKGFFMQLFVYFVVNIFLVLVNIFTLSANPGQRSIWEFWAIWPILGWGIGMLIYGFKVFFNNNEELRMRELEIELGIPTNARSRY